MPHTLVTGANSFVAAHIINELIAEGHTVTGTVRREAAGKAVLDENPGWKDKVDFLIIKDYSDQAALNAVFKARDFDHVVHVAAPIPGNPELVDYDKDFLRPTVDSNVTLLRAAKNFAPSLKSIAVTGSINSITTGVPEDNKAREYTNESWNDITPEFARKLNNDFISYCSSKKEAELALWDFVKNEKPTFTSTVFLPALIFGPPLQGLPDAKNLNLSVNLVYRYFNGTFDELPNTNSAIFPSYVDVRDLATAHVRALTTPEAANKRFLVGGEPLTSSLIVNTLTTLSDKGVLPSEFKRRLPKDTGKDVDLALPRIHAEEGNTIFKLKLRGPEETFGDLVKKVLELEKKGSN